MAEGDDPKSPLTADKALLDLVYAELHRLASAYLRQERPGHTLQTSALVNEAYLRLAQDPGLRFDDRRHYIRLASRAMRQVLVDYARRRSARKREPEWPVEFKPGWVDSGNLEDYLTLDRALQKLSGLDARQAEIVDLRFFGGLSVPETAEAMDISEKTVKREWAMARAWLRGELDEAVQI